MAAILRYTSPSNHRTYVQGAHLYTHTRATHKQHIQCVYIHIPMPTLNIYSYTNASRVEPRAIVPASPQLPHSPISSLAHVRPRSKIPLELYGLSVHFDEGLVRFSTPSSYLPLPSGLLSPSGLVSLSSFSFLIQYLCSFQFPSLYTDIYTTVCCSLALHMAMGMYVYVYEENGQDIYSKYLYPVWNRPFGHTRYARSRDRPPFNYPPNFRSCDNAKPSNRTLRSSSHRICLCILRDV